MTCNVLAKELNSYYSVTNDI